MRPTRNISRLALLFLAALIQATPLAAQTAQSDWPCKQVRVPDIALGGVWSGPANDAERKSWREDRVVADLVAHIAPRRTPLESADRMIADFAATAGDKRKALAVRYFPRPERFAEPEIDNDRRAPQDPGEMRDEVHIAIPGDVRRIKATKPDPGPALIVEGDRLNHHGFANRVI